MTETPLATHELRLLVTLDNFFIAEERKARAQDQRKKTQTNKSKARSR